MMDMRVVHVNQSPGRDPHPEPLPPHRLRLDCESKHGFPMCMGCAISPDRCTCTDTLSKEDYEKCVAEAWEAFRARGGDMCHDCAFRKGSPEEEQLAKVSADPEPFRCHQGMPVDARGGVALRDCYAPVLCPGELGGQTAPEYPICAGWLRARAALAKRAASKPERVQLRRVKGYRKPEGAVVVTRQSKWGNPYRLDSYTFANADGSPAPWNEKEARAMALRDYEHALFVGALKYSVDDVKRELKGKTLACFCPLSKGCHADVLLRVAAGGEP